MKSIGEIRRAQILRFVISNHLPPNPLVAALFTAIPLVISGLPLVLVERCGSISHAVIGRFERAADLHAMISAYYRPDSVFPVSFGKTPILNEAAQQLREYFDQKRKSFDLPLSPHGTPFRKKVWKELRKIEYGTALPYGEIARRIGNSRAARAVGNAVHWNPILLIIPCHRVVAANGLGGFGSGLELKKRLLKLEGYYPHSF